MPALQDARNGAETAGVGELREGLSESDLHWLVRCAWGELRPVQILWLSLLQLLIMASWGRGFYFLRNPFMVSGPPQRHFFLETEKRAARKY